MMYEATKEAHQQFPHCNVNAVARIVELMGWDKDDFVLRDIARSGLQMFLTQPAFAGQRSHKLFN
jgi:hypothetical protein